MLQLIVLWLFGEKDALVWQEKAIEKKRGGGFNVAVQYTIKGISRLTVHRKCACRSLNDSFPCMLAWGRVNQPSGSSSGPGNLAFSRYAATRIREKGSGVISGMYTTSTFNLTCPKWFNDRSEDHSGSANTHLESARSIPWFTRNIRSYCRDVFVPCSRNDRGVGYAFEKYWCCPRMVTSFGKVNMKGHVY